MATGSLAGNLPAAWLFQTVFDLSVLFVLLTAKKPQGLAAQQRTVNLFAYLLQRGFAQPEQFAV